MMVINKININFLFLIGILTISTPAFVNAKDSKSVDTNVVHTNHSHCSHSFLEGAKSFISYGIDDISTLIKTKALVKDNFTVVLDAGHGGHDGGAQGPYGNEKNVTLAVALKLGAIIEKQSNVKVIYTRKTDVFIELAKRAQIANDAKADLFISIHCNSAHAGASGTETWVLGTEDNRQGDNFSVVQRENSVIYLEDNYEETYDGFDPNSTEDIIAMTLMQDAHYDNSVFLAQAMENEFVKDRRKSRGVKQSGFAVLWRTAMPSVLIETGFISNPTEGKYICSTTGQKEIASSIYSAYSTYKKIWDKKHTQSQHKSVEIKPKVKEKKAVGIEYGIQFLASKNLYKENAMQFRGLKDVTIIKEGEFYKYFYGNTSFPSEKNENLQKAKKMGFNSAFVVAFKEKDVRNYAINLFSSNKKYNTKHSIFKTFTTVERNKSKGKARYDYVTSATQNFKQVKLQLEKAKQNGFPNAMLTIVD